MDMKRQFLIFIVVTPFVTSGMLAIMLILFMMFNALEVNLQNIIGTLVLIVTFIIFHFFYHLLKNEYKMKYVFQRKKMNNDISFSVEKFKGGDEKFIKDYISFCKKNYKKTGFIGFEIDSTDFLYKEENTAITLKNILEIIISSINSKGGFLEFFERLRQIKFLDSYEVFRLLQINVISNELKYLMLVVFNLTYFNLNDNGLSKVFTEKNEKLKNDMDSIYSPILFNFKDEITENIKYLEYLTNNDDSFNDVEEKKFSLN